MPAGYYGKRKLVFHCSHSCSLDCCFARKKPLKCLHCGKVRREPISFDLLRSTFMLRWVNAGGDLANLSCISGRDSMMMRHFDMPTSSESRFSAAAKFQARLEDYDL